jgi:hypothetical protein
MQRFHKSLSYVPVKRTGRSVTPMRKKSKLCFTSVTMSEPRTCRKAGNVLRLLVEQAVAVPGGRAQARPTHRAIYVMMVSHFLPVQQGVECLFHGRHDRGLARVGDDLPRCREERRTRMSPRRIYKSSSEPVTFLTRKAKLSQQDLLACRPRYWSIFEKRR